MSADQSQSPALVADIGGTNARFALVAQLRDGAAFWLLTGHVAFHIF